MLTCPSCSARLRRTPTRHGAVHLCDSCGGRGVSFGVLDKHAPADVMSRLRSKAGGSRSGKGRRCPACARPMAVAEFSPREGGLELDVCGPCRFVWFDPTEYERLRGLRPGAPSAAGPSLAAGAPAGMSHARRPVEMGTSIAAWQWIPAIFGMPIEQRASLVRRRPVLTWSLAAVMVAVHLLLVASGRLSEAVMGWGFIPEAALRHHGLTFLTGFFLHGGFLHLASNLYFLLVFGDNVEDHLGRGRFLLLLAGAHVAGSLLHGAFDPHGHVPCIGASAGIAGVIAYYAVVFPGARIGILIWFWFIPRWFSMSAIVAVLLYVLLQSFGAWQQVRGFSGVSYLAHVGGLGVGFALGLLSRALRTAPAA